MIKNDASEFARGDDEVSRLLSAMKRVEAPSDFDFRVKARIAAGRPAGWRPFGLPVTVGYAMPLVLLVLIGAYFGFNALNANKPVNAPTVAEAVTHVTPLPPTVAASQPAEPSNDVIATPANPGTEESASVKKKVNSGGESGENPAKKLPHNALPSKQSGSGSYDSAGNKERKIYPRGINPNQLPPSKSSGLDRTAPVEAQVFLNFFGMKGSFGDAGWKVESVTPDTLATRSGVKAGDVIEAIDDQALSDKTTFKGKYNAKSLRVRRDGTSIQIVLKN